MKFTEWLNENNIEKYLSEQEDIKKSTWNSFLDAAKKGLMYMGSTFNSNPDKVKELINQLKDNKPFKVDRILDKGSSVLQFKLPDNSVSRLQKTGEVFEYKNYYIIYDKSDGNNVVVYRIR